MTSSQTNFSDSVKILPIPKGLKHALISLLKFINYYAIANRFLAKHVKSVHK